MTRFKKGQVVMVRLKLPVLDQVVAAPAVGALGQPLEGMIRTRAGGNLPEYMLEPVWFDKDGEWVPGGAMVRTILGHVAQVVHIDSDGYAELDGLTGTRYVPHLEVIRE